MPALQPAPRGRRLVAAACLAVLAWSASAMAPAGAQEAEGVPGGQGEAAAVNWLLGRRVDMSPATGASQPAARTVDGDPSTSAVTGGRAGVTPRLHVDLDSMTRIATVRVTAAPGPMWLATGDERGIPGSTVAQAEAGPGVEVRRLSFVGGVAEVVVERDVRHLRVLGAVGASLSVAELEGFTDPTHTYVVDPGEVLVSLGQSADVALDALASGPVRWSARGLPRWLALDADSGRLAGTPTTTGRWPIEVTATHDGTGPAHTAKLSVIVTPGSPDGEVRRHPAIDPATIEDRPVRSWGVVGASASDRTSGGNPNDTTPSLRVTVWDLQQIGPWMYVGGEFNRVMAPDGTTYPQAHLARFSVESGEWDAGWRPVLDGNVHALDVNDRGRLLVGGEFTSIDGVAGTAAIAAIDPGTGRVDPSFSLRLERRFSSARPLVRELRVVGRYVYAGGNFSHAISNGQTLRAFNAVRVTQNYGSIDPTWTPRVMGGSVWGFGVDQANGLVHLAGWFSSVDGRPGTNRVATVDTVSGAVATTATVARNSGQIDVYDVEAAGGKLWMAGSEHVLAVMEPFTRQILAWNTAGYVNPQNYPNPWQGGGGLGGDFQFAEQIGDFVYAGCHCSRDRWNAHWSSVTQRFTNHVVANAYAAADGGLFEPWNADVGGGIDGAWAAASDDQGCLWIGGDILDGGILRPGPRVFARGFARFCPPGGPDSQLDLPTDLQAVESEEPGSVALSWVESDPRGVKGYFVTRDGARLGWLPVGSSTFVDAGPLVAGRSYTYALVVEDQLGRTADGPSVAITTAADTMPPSVPSGLAAVLEGDRVSLAWEPSTDDRALSGYLVFRDGAYQGFTAATTWTQSGLLPGSYTYVLRAVDVAQNRSERSEPVTVSVPGAG
jgi:hypothetical protein